MSLRSGEERGKCHQEVVFPGARIRTGYPGMAVSHHRPRHRLENPDNTHPPENLRFALQSRCLGPAGIDEKRCSTTTHPTSKSDRAFLPSLSWRGPVSDSVGNGEYPRPEDRGAFASGGNITDFVTSAGVPHSTEPSPTSEAGARPPSSSASSIERRPCNTTVGMAP